MNASEIFVPLLFLQFAVQYASAMLRVDKETSQDIQDEITRDIFVDNNLFAKENDVVYLMAKSWATAAISEVDFEQKVTSLQDKQTNISVELVEAKQERLWATDAQPTVFIFPKTIFFEKGVNASVIRSCSWSIPEWLKMNLARIAIVSLEYKDETDTDQKIPPVFRSVVVIYPVPADLPTTFLTGKKNLTVKKVTQRKVLQMALSEGERLGTTDTEFRTILTSDEVTRTTDPKNIPRVSEAIASKKSVVSAYLARVPLLAWSEVEWQIVTKTNAVCLIFWKLNTISLATPPQPRSGTPHPRDRIEGGKTFSTLKSTGTTSNNARTRTEPASQNISNK